MSDKISVLNVDDEPINLKLFEINFGRRYNVVVANSGYEALSILRLNPDIKVVISDMSMPGMNGLEFIKQAKEEFSDIIFYILTGYDITDEIKGALDDQLINKYFRKPLNAREIEQTIEIVRTNLTQSS